MYEIQGQFRRRGKEVESATRIGRSGTVRSCDGPRVDRSRSETSGPEESTLGRVHTTHPAIRAHSVHLYNLPNAKIIQASPPFRVYCHTLRDSVRCIKVFANRLGYAKKQDSHV